MRLIPWLQRSADVLAWVGTALLLFACAVISIDVLLRWLFSSPIVGRADIEKLSIAVALVMGFPAVLLNDRGVTVRALGGFIGRYSATGRLAVRGFGILCSAVFFGIGAWQLIKFTLDAAQARETMLTLPVPVWPFWAVVSFGLILSVLAAIGALFRLHEGPGEDMTI